MKEILNQTNVNKRKTAGNRQPVTLSDPDFVLDSSSFTEHGNELTLDPENWEETRKLGHQMVDDMINYLEGVRQRKVWQPMSHESKKNLNQPLPLTGQKTAEVYKDFRENILPYALGNIHPRFWGWVCGTGSATGMFADMLASAMNSSPSFGEHGTIYVENQVIGWAKEIFGFPEESSGILTSGASIGNILALAVARNSTWKNIRKHGLRKAGRLTVYASSETHSCIQKGVELLGLGDVAYRRIPVDDQFRIRIDLLEEKIREDKINGLQPVCIIGNAGTVNTGAIDDLDALGKLAEKENTWFHVDGAIGAILSLLPEYNNLIKGMEKADSLAFDFHKWFYVNYDVGGVLIRNAAAHKKTFEINASYLAHHEKGIIAGELNYNHLGMELSRGARALKVWMMIKENGMEKYRQLVSQNIRQAQYLGELVNLEDKLELVTPVTMNIVCFRYKRKDWTDEQLNELNKEILMQLHERGIAAPSFTILRGKYVIRVANTNHRSRYRDFEILADAVIRLGDELSVNKNFSD